MGVESPAPFSAKQERQSLLLVADNRQFTETMQWLQQKQEITFAELPV